MSSGELCGVVGKSVHKKDKSNLTYNSIYKSVHKQNHRSLNKKVSGLKHIIDAGRVVEEEKKNLCIHIFLSQVDQNSRKLVTMAAL